jgi:hypothetical protein
VLNFLNKSVIFRHIFMHLRRSLLYFQCKSPVIKLFIRKCTVRSYFLKWRFLFVSRNFIPFLSPKLSFYFTEFPRNSDLIAKFPQVLQTIAPDDVFPSQVRSAVNCAFWNSKISTVFLSLLVLYVQIQLCKSNAGHCNVSTCKHSGKIPSAYWHLTYNYAEL